MRHSIRVRLTSTFIALAICPILLVGVVLAWRSYSVQQEQALQLQRQVAQRVSTEVGAFFSELESELRVVGRIQDLPRLDPDQQSRILSELLLLQSAFEELTLVDSQGHARAHASRSRLRPPAIPERAGSPTPRPAIQGTATTAPSGSSRRAASLSLRSASRCWTLGPDSSTPCSSAKSG